MPLSQSPRCGGLRLRVPRGLAVAPVAHAAGVAVARRQLQEAPPPPELRRPPLPAAPALPKGRTHAQTDQTFFRAKIIGSKLMESPVTVD